jgi:hypothetical protein
MIVGIGVAGLVLDPTLNGRTSNYSRVLQQLRGNFVFGNGPNIGSSVNGVENSYVTLLSYYGVFGIVAIGCLLSGISLIYKKSPESIKRILAGILIPLLITSLGEFILVGGAYDIGLVYICLILAIRLPRKRKSD